MICVTVFTRMPRCMAISRIFLFLFIVRFALAVPVVPREAHKIRVNVVVDVARGGTATSQERWDSGPRDDWLVNTANQAIAPTTPRLSDLDDSQMHSSKTSRRSNNEPSSSALSTRPHARAKDDVPQPNSALADISQASNPAAPDNPASSSEPPGPIESETKDLIGQLSSKPSHLANPGLGPLYLAEPDPSHLSESGSSPLAEPETKNFLGQFDSGPSHASPLAEPETKDFLGQFDSGPSHASPPAEPETKNFLGLFDSGPLPLAEPEAKDFLGIFLSDKLKRRNSDSDAANSSQESQDYH